MPTVSFCWVFILLPCLIKRVNCSSDINECKVLADACHKDAHCSNYDGSYTCTCVSGYAGNGTVCIAPQKCPAQLDLIFLLDASGSVGKENYVKEKEFIKIVASRYELGATSQAAVIPFSDQATNEVPLGSKNTSLSFASAVDNIPYKASFTRIDLALRLAYDEYFSSEDWNETQKLVILLTDGMQTHSSSYIPIEVTVQLLRSKAARIFAVTIGSNIDMSAMRVITEKDDDIFQATEFDDLVAKADSISKTSCVDALQSQEIAFCSFDPEMTNCEFPAHCVNTSSGVSCICSDGYIGDPPQCEDVNECTNGSHDCPVNAYCINLPGSYNCSCNQSGCSYNGSRCAVCGSLTNNQSQFWCNVSGVERCVSNLTECSCPPNQTYCPSNNSCQAQQTYNESWCRSDVSCAVEPTTVTEYGSTASGGAGFIEPTTVTEYGSTAAGGAGFIVSTASSLASASSSKTSDGHVSTTPASTTFHPLDTDYTPIIISIAAGFACFILYVCFMCIVHSWWLKRNKFTGVNSTPLKEIEQRKRKEELRELRRQRKEREAREPSKFDMGYRKPQKVNERALANYDWARTSYLPGMLEPSSSQPNPVGITPKLICDDEDTDFDNPNELGDENKAYESGQEDEDNTRKLTTPASLFSPIEVEPQEPVMVEPEIFESMEEIPRPPPDGDVADRARDLHSQDYFNMMGRF